MCPVSDTNGQNGLSGQNGHSHKAAHANPYAPVGDFLSNVSRFKIIESTLREGEQFANAFFDTGKFTSQTMYHNLLLII
jgi:homocitrate synthase